MDKPEKEKILKELGGISEPEYDAFVKEFIAQAEKQLVELKAALEDGNFGDAARIAHSIKGSSGNLRIYKIQEQAGLIEPAAREKNRGGVEAALKRLEEALEGVKRG